VALFADLWDLTIRAVEQGDEDFVRRVCEYAAWADQQVNAGRLRSAADTVFFLPMLGNPSVLQVARRFLPDELIERKHRLLDDAAM
jgi:hypothetical protein